MSDTNYPDHLKKALGPGAGGELTADEFKSLLSKDAKIVEIISKHYTDLYIYQARQRLDSIRFFFVGYAVFATAVTGLAVADHKLAASILSGIAGIVSLIFLRLDYRNAQIVEIDEKPLMGLQKFIRDLVGADESWETFKRCDQTSLLISYRSLAVCLYSVFWVTSFAASTALVYLSASDAYPECALAIAILAGIVFLFMGIGGCLGRPRP